MSSICASTNNFYNTDDSRVMVFPKEKLDEIRQRLRGEDEGVVQHDFLTNIATNAAKNAFIEAAVARAQATEEDIIDSDQEADRCNDDAVSMNQRVHGDTVAVTPVSVHSCAATGDDIGLGMQIASRGVCDSMQSIFMMGDDTYIEHDGIGKGEAPMHNGRESCVVSEDSRSHGVCETGGQHMIHGSLIINSPNEDENGVGTHVLTKVRDIASRAFRKGGVDEKVTSNAIADADGVFDTGDCSDTEYTMCTDSDSDDDSCQSWVANAVNTSVELGGHVWNGVHSGFSKVVGVPWWSGARQESVDYSAFEVSPKTVVESTLVDAGLDNAVDALQCELSVPSSDACGTYNFDLNNFGHSRYVGIGTSSATDLCVRESAKFEDHIERCYYPYLQTQAVLNNVNAFAVLQGIDEAQCQCMLENSHSFE